MRNGPEAALRRDVRLLGEVLGRVLVEQGGKGLLADEERIRELSRRARASGRPSARTRLSEAVAKLPLERQGDVLRAFSLYFQLASLAEQHHRLRRRREYEHEQRIPRESLAEAFARLEEAGVTPRQLAAAGRRLSLELVLTAHPTEATRRTVLALQLRVDRRLDRLDDPTLQRSGREEAFDAIAEEVTALWQTDEVRSHRPRVVDEIRHGLWFFETSLLDGAPELVADLRRRLPSADAPLRFGSWIGGDQDGNPAAGPRTIKEAAARARAVALARYRAEVRELAASLGVADTLVEVSPELRRSIRKDEREFPAYAARIGSQNEDEPYRRKLSFVWHRLGADGYSSPREFLADLDLVDRSLRANRGKRLADGRLAPLRRRVELFGFHLAKLDVRPARAGARAPDRADAQDVRGSGERPATLRRGGPRLARHLGNVLRGGRRRRARAGTGGGRAPLARPPLRDDRRPAGGAARRRGAAHRPPVRACRRAARTPARGHGRLLGLGEGRGLPGRAVGDLPRAGGAREGGEAAPARADDLPRPRPQRRPRRRADPRGDPRPARRPPARPAEDHRARRDDLLQVRAPGARVPEHGGGAWRRRCSPPSRTRTHRPARATRSPSSPTGPAPRTASLSGRTTRSCGSSAPSRRSRRSRCSRSVPGHRGDRAARTCCARCARSPGSSPGPRTAACSRPGSGAARRSRTRRYGTSAASTARSCSSARSSRTSR